MTSSTVTHDPPSVLQCVLFGALALLALLPLVALICRFPSVRAKLSTIGCLGCVTWCDRVFPNDSDTVRLEQGDDQQTHSIAAYYQLLYCRDRRHEPAMALRLAGWRNDQRRHHTRRNGPATVKLQHIQIKIDLQPHCELSEPLEIGRAVLQATRVDPLPAQDENDEEEKDGDA